MSVHIHPTSHPASCRDDTTAAPVAAKSGPVTRIIAGSLAAGAAMALVLTLVEIGRAHV